jgi:predicted ester cyclase
MRQGWFALLLVGCSLLFGLGRAITVGQEATATAGSVATPTSCPSTSPEENVAIARAWHEEVINHRNPAVLADILDPHAVHHAAGGYPQEMDPAGATAMMNDFLAAFPDIQITYDLWLQQDDYVIERYTASGTQQGQFGDLPPSGKRATWTGINIFRVECGRIVEIWSEVDAVSRRQQLTGEIPATPAPEG